MLYPPPCANLNPSSFNPKPPLSTSPPDHRTKNNYDLNKILEGGLEDSIQAVLRMEQQEALRELAESMKE